MPALLLVLGLAFIAVVVGLIVPRAASSARAAAVEPLSAVADRVIAQLRSLPETHEPKTPGQS